eukprot:12066798-Heterocapsa_arctica.AAC.1
MGNVCVQIKSVADFNTKKDKLCKKPHSCLICKAYADTNESQKYTTDQDKRIGMTEWMKQMKDDKTWAEATIEKKLLMTCHHLSTTKVRTER